MPKIPALKHFYTHRMGMVTLQDDVLGVVQQVRELYDGKVHIELDEDTGWFHLIEECEDGTDRLIFSVEELDARVLTRLQEGDSRWRYHEDPYAAAEREQDENRAAIDKAHSERLLETGEMLAHALKREGKAPRLPLSVAIPKDLRA